MWIASKLGFYSIVYKPSHLDPDGPPAYLIRARDKADLTRLVKTLKKNPYDKDFLKVHEYARSDYPYRIIARDTAMLHAILECLGDSVDYDNFKDKIHDTPHQRDKLAPYEGLWELLYNALYHLRPK